MKKAKDYKENKKPLSKAEVMDEIVPSRSVRKVAEKLEEHKKLVRDVSVPYYATKYGFKKELILFMAPGLSDDFVKAKFEKRFNSSSDVNNFKPKLHMKV